MADERGSGVGSGCHGDHPAPYYAHRRPLQRSLSTLFPTITILIQNRMCVKRLNSSEYRMLIRVLICGFELKALHFVEISGILYRVL